MNNQDTGFVLSNTPYREHDAMVLFVGKDFGMFRYVLRGYHKPKAKQTSLGLEFTKVRLRFDYRENSLQMIKNGELIESYQKQRGDYDWLVSMSLFSEVLHKFYDKYYHKFWYQYCETVFVEMNLAVLTVFLKDVIVLLGITPVVDYCVVTGTTSVSDFSIEKGGFVSKAFRKGDSTIDLNLLKMIRYIFTKDVDLNILKNYDDLRELTNLLVKYLEFYETIRINSWKLMY